VDTDDTGQRLEMPSFKPVTQVFLSGLTHTQTHTHTHTHRLNHPCPHKLSHFQSSC